MDNGYEDEDPSTTVHVSVDAVLLVCRTVRDVRLLTVTATTTAISLQLDPGPVHCPQHCCG